MVFGPGSDAEPYDVDDPTDLSEATPEENLETHRELKGALSSLGNWKNRRTALKVLCSRTWSDRVEVMKQFGTVNTANPIELMRGLYLKRTWVRRKQFKQLLDALTTDPHEHDASTVKDAVQGLGTDDDTLVEVICSRTKEELSAIVDAYERMYGNPEYPDTEPLMVKDVRQDTSGHYRSLLLALLTRRRSADPPAWLQDEFVFCEADLNKDNSALRSSAAELNGAFCCGCGHLLFEPDMPDLRQTSTVSLVSPTNAARAKAAAAPATAPVPRSLEAEEPEGHRHDAKPRAPFPLFEPEEPSDATKWRNEARRRCFVDAYLLHHATAAWNKKNIETFVRLLTERSVTHLRAVFAAYRVFFANEATACGCMGGIGAPKIEGSTEKDDKKRLLHDTTLIERLVVRTCSLYQWDLKRALLILVRTIGKPGLLWAYLIQDALAGSPFTTGINTAHLTRVFVYNFEHLYEIEAHYNSLEDATNLEQHVRDHTKGDYRRGLLMLLAASRKIGEEQKRLNAEIERMKRGTVAPGRAIRFHHPKLDVEQLSKQEARVRMPDGTYDFHTALGRELAWGHKWIVNLRLSTFEARKGVPVMVRFGLTRMKYPQTDFALDGIDSIAVVVRHHNDKAHDSAHTLGGGQSEDDARNEADSLHFLTSDLVQMQIDLTDGGRIPEHELEPRRLGGLELELQKEAEVAASVAASHRQISLGLGAVDEDENDEDDVKEDTTPAHPKLAPSVAHQPGAAAAVAAEAAKPDLETVTSSGDSLEPLRAVADSISRDESDDAGSAPPREGATAPSITVTADPSAPTAGETKADRLARPRLSYTKSEDAATAARTKLHAVHKARYQSRAEIMLREDSTLSNSGTLTRKRGVTKSLFQRGVSEAALMLTEGDLSLQPEKLKGRKGTVCFLHNGRPLIANSHLKTPPKEQNPSHPAMFRFPAVPVEDQPPVRFYPALTCETPGTEFVLEVYRVGEDGVGLIFNS